ncbi:MAG TPA: arylsulfotransferase family protein [Solirubrobacteraceae bacterium]|nr:arylsulfotransferase family protein [Solirubrobacteraceae bacterium]
MRINVCRHKPSTAGGMVFLGPFRNANNGGSFVGQSGALMVDGRGDPVWFHPVPRGDQASDFQTDTYYTSKTKHEPVISFWQGAIAIPPKYLPSKYAIGAPVHGNFFIYNQHYKLVRQIKAVQSPGKGWITDFHELVLTKPTKSHPKGTAIFLAAKKVSKNLRPYGGSPNGAYEDEEIQQVDLASNKLVFHWDVAKHVSLRDSKVHPKKNEVWDPYHANSISLNSSGDMLISLRNTWGAYNIKPMGSAKFKFVWKLINGKGSSYSLNKASRFAWQHDVRFHGSGEVSMFDDQCCNLGVHGPLGPARGLVLRLSKHHATVVRQVHHYNTREVPTAGNYQQIGSHSFIGWGQSFYYSEYSKTNSLLYDAAMPRSNMSYRAVKANWVGLPTTKPSAAVRHPKGKLSAVFASWNGATKVAVWKLFAGTKPGKVTGRVATVKQSGFETALRTKKRGPYYQVKAYDSHGKLLGTSAVVH